MQLTFVTRIIDGKKYLVYCKNGYEIAQYRTDKPMALLSAILEKKRLWKYEVEKYT